MRLIEARATCWTRRSSAENSTQGSRLCASRRFPGLSFREKAGHAFSCSRGSAPPERRRRAAQDKGRHVGGAPVQSRAGKACIRAGLRRMHRQGVLRRMSATPGVEDHQGVDADRSGVRNVRLNCKPAKRMGTGTGGSQARSGAADRTATNRNGHPHRFRKRPVPEVIRRDTTSDRRVKRGVRKPGFSHSLFGHPSAPRTINRS